MPASSMFQRSSAPAQARWGLCHIFIQVTRVYEGIPACAQARWGLFSVNIFTGLAQKLTGRREAIASTCVCLGLRKAHTPPTPLICPVHVILRGWQALWDLWCRTAKLCGALPADALRLNACEPWRLHAHVLCLASAWRRPTLLLRYLQATSDSSGHQVFEKPRWRGAASGPSGCCRRAGGGRSLRPQPWHVARLFRCPLPALESGASD